MEAGLDAGVCDLSRLIALPNGAALGRNPTIQCSAVLGESCAWIPVRYHAFGKPRNPFGLGRVPVHWRPRDSTEAPWRAAVCVQTCVPPRQARRRRVRHCPARRMPHCVAQRGGPMSAQGQRSPGCTEITSAAAHCVLGRRFVGTRHLTQRSSPSATLAFARSGTLTLCVPPLEHAS